MLEPCHDGIYDYPIKQILDFQHHLVELSLKVLKAFLFTLDEVYKQCQGLLLGLISIKVCQKGIR